MATADHDRQGQAAHRQYKSRTVVGFTSGKYTHDQQLVPKEIRNENQWLSAPVFGS